MVSAGLSGRRVYVASWADERAENKAGWAEMGAPQLSEPEAMTWDPATSTCNNVVAGLAYEFLTARVGPVRKAPIGNANNSYFQRILDWIVVDVVFVNAVSDNVVGKPSPVLVHPIH